MAKGRKIIVANWKMNPHTLQEASRLYDAVKKAAGRRTTAVVCPPFVYLSTFQKRGRGKVTLGAQDVSSEEGGAHTGEVSAAMLKNLGVSYCLVGHSERRAQGETNDIVCRKLHGALAAGLTVILCIGERERDREVEYLSFLEEELRSALTGLQSKEVRRLIVAYEPLWAIGKTASDAMKPEDVHETVLYIRKLLTGLFDRKTAEAVPVLYGGSVELRNVMELLERGEANGFLVGHASLDAKQFAEMLALVDHAK